MRHMSPRLGHSQFAIIHRTVREMMGRAPPTAERTATIGDVIRLIAAAPQRLLVVVDQDSVPIGVITEGDLVRRAALGDDSDRPIDRNMIAPVVHVGRDDSVLYAIAIMRRRGFDALPVVDADGRLVGLLSLTDALVGMIGPAMRLVELLTADDTVDGLKRIKTAQTDLASALLADDVPVPQIQGLLTEINADLHRRVLQRTIDEMAANGWGAPPVPFALIVMGSAGRGESALAPDQDNGFILADYGDSDRTRFDAYFSALGERFAAVLAEIGFATCRGGVMASNAQWRRRLSDWKSEIGRWIDRRAPQQLLASDILFDFAHVGGDRALSDALRGFITEKLATSPRFLRDLYAIESDHTVALGWFGRLRPDPDEDVAAQGMNLKMSGTLPLVEGARLLSLAAGVPATGTLARLERLAALGRLPATEYDALAAAYGQISLLVLRQQIANARAGREVDDYVAEEDLTAAEQDRLVAALRLVAAFRARLNAEFGTGPFG
jgi:CBS domain-containing protein